MSLPADRSVAATAPVIPQQRSAASASQEPYLRTAVDVLAGLGTDPEAGLSYHEAARRLQDVGPNKLSSEKPPSIWVVALSQLRDPMNIMLIVVAVASLLIAQVSTAVLVAALVLLNVVLGTRQELKARASVDEIGRAHV